ncbi:TRAP transporter 4TM/12TM fusion protein [Rubricella aquisinus]|uniref:TRAP transporter 4TM/12TM fusion protein n=1 Tax=Rubricella aquisinus TaxID=2028108 RepID=A0A840WMA9_9RHOB|nr:TRAP transporter fused permease subunit [Rubricella aquisinus]MBB5516218.1 TRAP transporter 4TM/12TM fusion protein [Rubricella aquisinus]
MTDATDEPRDEEGAPLRTFDGIGHWLISGLCLVIAVFHLFVAIFPVVSEFDRNVFHFGGFAILAAAMYPMFRRKAWKEGRLGIAIDVTIGIVALCSGAWFILMEEPLYGANQPFGTLDWIAAICLVVFATELTRRVAGWVIPILVILSLTYVAVWGPWIGGVFSFPGFTWESTLWRSIYNDEGIFGNIARISSTYVFLFIIFGAFLVRSGAGDFVIALARAVAGRIQGGPGIVAVISSGLTGTISGSAVANTASTGVITIPLMKKAGFQPKFAGGVEAAASTGGQLMPPIMGAGAFVMASFTQISYETIVAVAALPALLYFLTVAFFVRIEARRLDMPPLPADGETLMGALKKGGAPFIIPIGLLITMLVMGFTPTYAGVFGIAAVIVSSWASANPMGPKAIMEALIMGSKSMVMTAILLCAVGLVVNVITTAGIGNVFSLQIAGWAGGNILIAIVLIALASLVLGMGLPVTAAYIVLATLSAPALSGMIADREVIALIAAGELPDFASALFMLSSPEVIPLLSQPMPQAEAAALVASLPIEVAQPLRDLVVAPEVMVTAILSAHMIIFWLSQDSNVTPPVALASFTAAAIAKSKPMETGIASWKLAKGLYIVPVLFAYTPFLSGNWGEMFTIFAFACVGVYGVAGALQGGMEKVLNLPMRVIAGVGGAACMWPGSLMINTAGVVVVLALLAWNLKYGKQAVVA